MLEIRFSVQVLGLHVTQAFGLTRIENDDVCRELFVLANLHYSSYSHLPPFSILKLIGGWIDLFNYAIILSVVRLVTLLILKYVLDHGNDDDERQRHQHRWLTVGIRYCWYQLFIGYMI